MKVGIQKCGVMVIGAPGCKSRADQIPEKLEDEFENGLSRLALRMFLQSVSTSIWGY